jgi:O-antigen ligase
MNWLGFVLPKLIVLNLFLAVCFFFFIHKNIIQAPQGLFGIFKDRRVWGVLAYFTVLVFYTVFSIAPWASFFGISGASQGLLTYLSYFGVFVFALVVLPKEKHVQVFSWLRVINVVVVSYALIQRMGFDPLAFLWNTDAFLQRSFSTLGNPNWLAAFIVLTVPLFFHNKLRNVWPFLFLNGLALLMTGSKAAFLAVVFMGALAMGLSWKKFLPKWKSIITFLIIALVGVGLSLFFLYPNLFALTRSLHSRQIIWANTWKAVSENPWGYGLETMRLVYPRFNTPELWSYEDPRSHIDNPHNQMLELLVETGPLGLLLFYAMLGGIVFPALRKNENDITRLLALGVVGYTMTNLFGFKVVPNEVVFWLFLGMLIVAKQGHDSDISSRFPVRYSIFGSIFLAVLSFALMVSTFFHGQHFYANTKSKPLAAALFPYDRTLLLDASLKLLTEKDFSPKIVLIIEEFLIQDRWLTHGQDPDLFAFEAWLAAKNGDAKKTENLLTKAKQNNPAAIFTYQIAAEAYKQLGLSQKAEIEEKKVEAFMRAYQELFLRIRKRAE